MKNDFIRVKLELVIPLSPGGPLRPVKQGFFEELLAVKLEIVLIP